MVYEAEKVGREVTEDDITRLCGEILEACRRRSGTVLFVTNEVGMGIIPDNPLARRYRDLAGRCNQAIAREAETVILMVSGIPVTIKGSL